ncbi:MAG: mechanosensitive ion channel domain-containing protein, partial [Acidobacteriota bacterium]
MPKNLTCGLLLAFVLWTPARAQQETRPQPTSQPAAQTSQPAPIPTARLSTAAQDARNLIRRSQADSQIGSEAAAIRRQLEALKGRLDALTLQTRQELAAGVPRRVLGDMRSDWRRRLDQVSSWQDDLNHDLVSLGSWLSQVQTAIDRWKLSRGRRGPQPRPEGDRSLIATTLQALESGQSQLVVRQSEVLNLQTSLTQISEHAQDMLSQIQIAQTSLRVRLLDFDRPIWKTFSLDQPAGHFSAVNTTLERAFRSLRSYLEDEWQRITLQLLLALLGIFVLTLVKRRQPAQLPKRLEAPIQLLLARPVSVAMLAGIALGALIHETPPSSWTALSRLLLLVPFFRLLPRLAASRLTRSLYVLGALYLVDQFVTLLPPGSSAFQLGSLALSAATLLLCRRAVIRMGRLPSPIPWQSLVGGGLKVIQVVLAASVLLNLLGNVQFASLLTQGAFTTLYLTVLARALAVLSEGAIGLLLRTNLLRRLRMVQSHSDMIEDRSRQVVKILLLALLLSRVLAAFLLLEPLQSLLSALFSKSLSVGNLQVSLGDVLTFFLIVWLSYSIAKLNGFVLGNEVLPRVTLPRGVSDAIVHLTHYSLVLVGFLMAAAAAGIDLSKLAFMAGALGVGIGFGLRDVVNNFVSGLILLFERPLQVGDRIQLGELLGDVKRIGIRASVVRTISGAEVVIPNGNLLSNDLINWTLSDRQRRVELDVGVAYGSDPDQVIEILRAVAQAHPDVRKV